MRVVIFGAGGQLGHALKEVLSASGRHSVMPCVRADVDVTDREAVERTVRTCTPDVVINAAAMTDVDGCERDEGSAYRTNALAVRWLASAAQLQGATLIHLSTDYVFNGEKGAPYHEWDASAPIQVYGRSKLAGEQEVRAHCPRHLIIRTSWLYGGLEKGFVRTILRLAKDGRPLSVVTNQTGSPSFTGDIAQGIADLMEAEVLGTVHLANVGRVSRYEFAQEIVSQAGYAVHVQPLDTTPSASLALRPADTSLESLVLEMVGIRMQTWQDGLRSFLNREA